MNKRMTLYLIATMLGAEGMLMLIPALVSIFYQERIATSFLVMSLILITIFLLGRDLPKNTTIYGKEGLVVVGAAWILWSFFGAWPYILSGYIPDFLNAFFESTSGFTTTGSSILTDVEILPKGLALWRVLTNWIGGMGVLVFVLMLTSMENDNTMHLMRAEVPGPEANKLVPRAKNTAKLLYSIYLILTGAMTLLLMVGGLSFFDAIVHAFSTAGTGGFSNRTDSISHFNSAYIDGIVSIFMVLFGINFNLYFLIRLKKWRAALKNEELLTYLGIIVASTAIITLNVLNFYNGSVARAFRYASFQVTSIISTTGLCTANYNLWPELSKNILLILMVIGSCAGSTGGGIKVSRFLIVLKGIRQEIRRMLHPKAVTLVRVNGKKVAKDTVNNVYIYCICYVFVMIISIVIISLDNFDFATTFTAVFTTISNVGPGLGAVGPADSFAVFSPLSKIILCMDMLFGRLEIFPYLLMLSPDLWRTKF